MLILRRRAGEAVLIGGDIELEILETTSSGVKIGLRAPKGIPILRKELQLTRAQNFAAAQPVKLAGLERIFSDGTHRRSPWPDKAS